MMQARLAIDFFPEEKKAVEKLAKARGFAFTSEYVRVLLRREILRENHKEEAKK